MRTLPHSADTSDPRPCVVYAAKSTDDVRGSIGTQIADCRSAIERAGSRVVVHEDQDEAKSAFHGSRGDGLARAKAAAVEAAREHGEAELWVQHSDRIARGDGRTADHLAEVFFAMGRAGVRLRSVQDDANLNDALHAVLMGERNHEDSRRKAEATAAGIRRAVERGEWTGGIVPDGYRADRSFDDHGRVRVRVVVDEERIDIYRLHFDLAQRGYSDRSIVQELERRGYRTRPQKAAHKPRPFDANRIRQTLTNPFYAGLAVHRGEIVGPGHWPAIITPDDFDALRAARRARSSADRRPKVGRPPEGYVLARVARCGDCGAPMDLVTSSYVRKDGSRARRYTCRTHRERPDACSADPLDAEVIDRAFVANLDGFLGDVGSWRDRLTSSRAADRARMAAEVASAESDRDAADRAVAAMEDRYATALGDGNDARADAIEGALQAKRADRARIETRLRAAQDAAADAAIGEDVDVLLDFFRDLSSELTGRVDRAKGDVKRLNTVVQEYFARVDLAQDGDTTFIQPVLADDTAHRILRTPGLWTEHHQVVAFIAGAEIPATLTDGDLHLDAAALEAAGITGVSPNDVEKIEISFEPGHGPPPTALPPGPIPPALRAIEVPGAKPSSTLAHERSAQVPRVILPRFTTADAVRGADSRAGIRGRADARRREAPV